MAAEFSREELAEYSAQNKHGYETLALMAPYWRSFLLDKAEKARLEMLDRNTRRLGSNAIYFSFAAKVTGIAVEQIESVGHTGDFITIVPTPDVCTFQEFLREKFPATTPLQPAG